MDSAKNVQQVSPRPEARVKREATMETYPALVHTALRRSRSHVPRKLPRLRQISDAATNAAELPDLLSSARKIIPDVAW
jgi:hypothetical protein